MRTDFDTNPFLVIWEVTRACQLACQHCRAVAQSERDPRELTTGEAKRLLDEIYEMGNPLLVLSGGDPLERPDLIELIDYGTQKGMRVSITPSATPKVTRAMVERAKEAGLSRWAFSLDGSNATIHDRFRGVSGSFAHTMQAVRWLQELRIPIQINTTVCQNNVHDLQNIAKLVEQVQAVLWSVFFLVPVGRGQLNDMISPQEHEQVLEWLVQLSAHVPFDIKTTEAHHYRRIMLQKRIAEHQQKKLGDVSLRSDRPRNRNNTAEVAWLHDVSGLTTDKIGRSPRGISDGNGFAFVSHIGDIYPSGFLPVNCGNIRRDHLADVYRNSPIFRALREPDRFRGKCGYCEFRSICGGSRARAYAVTGDFLESDPCCVHIPDPRGNLHRLGQAAPC